MRTIGLKIHDVSRLLKAEFERRARDTRLTLMQWRTLGELCRADGQTQTALAARLEVSPMTMSGILERLETMGCVRRGVDPADGRAKRVWITAEAVDLTQTMHPVVTEVYAKALAGLTPQDCIALENALGRIADNLAGPSPAASP